MTRPDPIQRAIDNLVAHDPELKTALRTYRTSVERALQATTRWVAGDVEERQQMGEVISSLLMQLREDDDGTRGKELVPVLIDRFYEVWYSTVPEGHVLAHAVGRLGRDGKVVRRLLFNEGTL